MNLSPKDLLQVRFRKVIFGYDPEEVEGFLELVREELEQLIRENQRLNAELASALEHLKGVREEEELLRQALLFAQKLESEVKAQAEKEAQLLVSEAELKARQIVAQELKRAQEIRSGLRQLWEARFEAIATLRKLAQHLLHIAEGYEEEQKREEEEVLLLAPPAPDPKR